MPPPLRRPIAIPKQTVVVPQSVALALRPSVDKREIPTRVTLTAQAPPFGGELREEQQSRIRRLPANQQALAVTLRRAWTFVGFAVDPGNVGVGGLSAFVKVITNGVQGFFPAQAIAPGRPQAFQALIVGARAELWILNNTGAPVTGIRATIWGMSER